ncbi:helix-turn-helix transcriptional regulator [Rhizobium leguminosarum]|uniref:helix-turn-helix domain-containing protein n=1 Tax=Rhizobium leguminosarum TaxID=384 RepID=UPI001C987CFD|nr:helix-turn-helix transcriptional regulator [Rhizobium leguminosarum]MBY5412952.1 helix-turn-helix transcriptional regulator [Rhizobium leguminosarum]
MTYDPARGKRIREAISRGKFRKVHALAAELNVSAAELNVSVAAVSRWQNGGHTSLESACALARLLDVSLDWLLLGRGTMDGHRNSAISATELLWVMALRGRSAAAQSNLIGLLESIPPEHALR